MSSSGNVLRDGHDVELLPDPVDPAPIRILLVGTPAFCHSVAGMVRHLPARVVGRAHTRDRAVELAASLAADVAVVGDGMKSIADRLSERSSVIILSSGEDAESPGSTSSAPSIDHDLLRLVTRLGAIEPPAPLVAHGRP
jgi:hypothetical protein